MMNARGSVSLGNVHCLHSSRYIQDETSKALSPSKRRAPVTYFRYPGLEAENLLEFLLEKNASRACIQKAVEDLGGVTPCPSVFDDSDVDKVSITSDDDVFLDDTQLESHTSTTLLLAQLSATEADDTFNESLPSSEVADVNPFTLDDLSFKDSDRLTPTIATDDETATCESFHEDDTPSSQHMGNLVRTKLKKRQRLAKFFRSLFRGRKFRRCHATSLNTQNSDVSQLIFKSSTMNRCRKCGIIANLGVHIC